MLGYPITSLQNDTYILKCKFINIKIKCFMPYANVQALLIRGIYTDRLVLHACKNDVEHLS